MMSKSIETKIALVQKDVKSILYLLQGNGTEGLVKKVERNTNWRWVLKGGIAVLTFLISIGLIKIFMR